MTAPELLSNLTIAAIMGMSGQLARTIAGMKTMNDWAKSTDQSTSDLFVLHRMMISIFIGGAAGVLTALSIDMNAIASDSKTLLGLAAAGYAGTDFIEAFVRRVPAANPAVIATDQSKDASADRKNNGEISALSNRVVTAETSIADLKSTVAAASFSANDSNADAGNLLDRVTPEIVKIIFPATPITSIRRHLPSVIEGLRHVDLIDRPMILMALSTIRAETEGFVPIDEGISRYNTKNYPFDLYEPGTSAGDRVGNTKIGDGARFKGRGFIQLTGRSNYANIGSEINIPLVDHPEYANVSGTAGVILATFLKNNERKIRQALDQNDLRTARIAVNGGVHGLDIFIDAYQRGDKSLPKWTNFSDQTA